MKVNYPILAWYVAAFGALFFLFKVLFENDFDIQFQTETGFDDKVLWFLCTFAYGSLLVTVLPKLL